MLYRRIAWKNIRLLKSTDRTYAMICSRHFKNDKQTVAKQHRNITKHANQIAYSIRQAEEYFESASVVSLATEPLLHSAGQPRYFQFVLASS